MKGQCHCGQISYTLESSLQEVYFCHCRDCQILSGSTHHLLGIVDRNAIQVVGGQTKAYRNPTDSGHEMTREFCPQCGTPLFVYSTRFPDIKMLCVSGLDDPAAVSPSFEIWTDSKINWDENSCHLKQFSAGALD